MRQKNYALNPIYLAKAANVELCPNGSICLNSNGIKK